MKVATLLKQLDGYDASAEVKLHHYGDEPLGAVSITKGTVILLGLYGLRKVNAGLFANGTDAPEYARKASTVGELKKALDDVTDKDSVVKMDSVHGYEILFTNARKDDHKIMWVDGEGDIDMGNEISTRFEDAIEEGLDEADMYSDMLEIGIGVDMVRKYMGDEDAAHMETFCKENGLL